VKVSVIIPTYNREHLVSEAISSVLAQDIEGCILEIIVVDDGSTDKTREVLKAFGDKIRYIYQENKGAGAARNRGIDEATGEWIAFLDSDDRWLPNKLSLQFKVLGAFPDFKIIHSEFYSFDDNARKITIEKGLEYWFQAVRGPGPVNWSEIYEHKYDSSKFGIYLGTTPFDIFAGNIFKAELVTNYISCVTLLLKKECLTPDIRFAENYPTWEDYWFFCKLTEKHDVIFMDVATAANRGHDGPRLTQVDLTEKLKCHLDMCNKIFVPSISKNRPSQRDIDSYKKAISIRLYKEYLKNGMNKEAGEVKNVITKLKEPATDSTYYLYRLVSLFPGNLIKHLASLKRVVKERSRTQ
jgi:glycosyltransferase involved in cell wall biosynthesis